MRLALAIALASLAACRAPSGNEQALEVIVRVDPTAIADWIEVEAWSQPGQELVTKPFSNTGATEYHVAIFPGGPLGSDLTLQARGYQGPNCVAVTSLSDQQPAHFATGVGTITLLLLPAAAGNDGGGPTMDGGSPSPDGGGGNRSDAGADAGNPTPDAGPQPCAAGMDAGDACGMNGICSSTGVCVPNFPYSPSNFTLPDVPSIEPPLTIGCGLTVDTSNLQGMDTVTFCNGVTVPVVVLGKGFGLPSVVLAGVAGLNVPSSGSITFTGDKPFIFAVYGDATVAGTLRASASGQTPGPGGDPGGCFQGGFGGFGFGASTTGSGGGGGGYGSAGAAGAVGHGVGGQGGGAGQPIGAPLLSPLIGGCSGGSGGFPNQGAGNGGGSGGAFQISASGRIDVSGTIAAEGGGGQSGSNNDNGGGGGGSGGGLLLEAVTVQVDSNGAITANGGGGGPGDDNGNAGTDGAPGHERDGKPAAGGPTNSNGGAGGDGGALLGTATNGAGPGGSQHGGGGGGGGGAGRVHFTVVNGCTLSNVATLSPAPTSSGNSTSGCP